MQTRQTCQRLPHCGGAKCELDHVQMLSRFPPALALGALNMLRQRPQIICLHRWLPAGRVVRFRLPQNASGTIKMPGAREATMQRKRFRSSGDEEIVAGNGLVHRRAFLSGGVAVATAISSYTLNDAEAAPLPVEPWMQIPTPNGFD